MGPSQLLIEMGERPLFLGSLRNDSGEGLERGEVKNRRSIDYFIRGIDRGMENIFC